MNTSSKTALMAVAIMILTLTGCGTSGIGDILGGGQQQPTNSSGEVRGTVDQVDNGSITLTNVDNGNYGRSNGDSVRIYFDSQTPVTYQGRNYRPQDLDRGDEISARVEQSGNRLIATSMTVTRNARDGNGGSSGGGFPNGGYPSRSNSNGVRGTVRYIDTSRRTIDVDDGYNGQSTTVTYDNNTYVTQNGRSARVQDLARGDEIDVRGRSSNGRVMADSIEVIRGGGTYGGSNGSNGSSSVRGTVRNVDTSRRTIELEGASWNNFDNRSGGGRNNTSVVVQYDNNTQVEYQGKSYVPSNLERGDVVDIQLRSGSGSSYFAERIVVVRDVKNSF